MKRSLFHIHGSYNFLIYIFLCINLLPCAIYGQEVYATTHEKNYASIFGEKYTEAATFLNNNSWIRDSLKVYNVDPSFAIAIVFPELIRYSAIRDKIEKGGLFSLYIYYGEKYANFSVGQFQMKPSFARQLEEDISKLPHKEAKCYTKLDASDNQEARKERVKRLDEFNWQVRYLALFIKIMDQQCKKKQWLTAEEKLKFYATAYNFGYRKSFESIYNAINKNSFHLGWSNHGELYCYADISVQYHSKKSN
jgi:hypothetical protein